MLDMEGRSYVFRGEDATPVSNERVPLNMVKGQECVIYSRREKK